MQPENIAEYLNAEYGLATPIGISRIHKGRATNYLVSDAYGGKYIFKKYQSELNIDSILAAAEATAFLADNGFPCEKFVAVKNGKSVVQNINCITALIPYISGQILPPDKAVLKMRELGRLLGICHALLSRRHIAGARAMNGFMESDLSASLTSSRALLAQVQQRECGEAFKTCDYLSAKIAMLERLGPRLAASLQSLPKHHIHGDFYCEHVVWLDDLSAVAGVIDITGMLGYQEWEIFRCFAQSRFGPETTAKDFNMDGFAEYIAGYLEGNPLFPGENIAKTLDAYLLHLLGSNYGIRQYLVSTQPDDKDAYLRFGFWRAEMALWLANEYDALSRKLSLIQ
jgi:hypothetical protein